LNKIRYKKQIVGPILTQYDKNIYLFLIKSKELLIYYTRIVKTQKTSIKLNQNVKNAKEVLN